MAHSDSKKKIADSKHQFAVDVINTVRDIYKFPITTGCGEDDLFTEDHKVVIARYHPSQERNIEEAIKKSVDGKSGPSAFKSCLDELTTMYKPDEYSEVGLVCFCSVIAFLGVYFSHKFKGSDGTKMAKDHIVSVLEGILSRGTLEKSSW